jgi:hypothetical protein
MAMQAASVERSGISIPEKIRGRDRAECCASRLHRPSSASADLGPGSPILNCRSIRLSPLQPTSHDPTQ